MKKILIFTIVTFLYSCNKKTVDLTKVIYVKMSYQEVLKIIGKPSDSIKYINSEGKSIYKLRYENFDNFSDYGFNVILNDSLKVIDRHYD